VNRIVEPDVKSAREFVEALLKAAKERDLGWNN
jgi:hypothetical protein